MSPLPPLLLQTLLAGSPPTHDSPQPIISDWDCPMPPQHHGPPPPDSDGYHLFLVGWALSGAFTVFSVCLSFLLVWQHWGYYHSPVYQKHIVRILFMVPVYSVCSCLGLAFRGMTVYLDVLRDCYEAVVIYEFFQLLLAYIGADIQAQAEVLASKPTMNFVFPLQRWTYRPSRPHFLHYCKIGTLQYVVLRPVTTVLAVVTQLTGKFCEDSMSPRFAHLWIIIVNSISVTVAMFALVQIYTTIKSELKGYHPVLKFVSIKFVIFFSFWQSVTISILSNTHIIHSTPHWSSLEISNSLNAFILCIEMAIAALLHTKAFSYTENLSPDLGPTYRWPAFKHCCFGFYSDFVLDVTVTQRFLTHRIRGETYTPADALNEAEAEGLLETVEDFIEEVAEEVKDAESGVDGAEIRVEKRKGDKTEVVEGKIEGAEGSETTTGAPVKSVVNRTVLEDGEPVVETRKEKDHGGD